MKLLARIATIVLLIALASCKDASFYGALGDKVVPKPVAPLVIAPVSASLLSLNTVTFSATGGTPPYTFSIASGASSGAVTSGGLFTAGTVPGTVGVQVTDSKGLISQATVTVTSLGGLSLNPSGTTNVNSHTSIQFVAAGGSGGAYAFSIVSKGSGADATINPSTGFYVAGSVGGIDTVDVTDGTTTTPVSTVNVTNTVTNVDYNVLSVANPGAGVSGKALTGYSFKIHNGGSAGGSKPIRWWAYLSDSANLNSAGMLMLDSDTTGAAPLATLADSGSITINGTWPPVPVFGTTTKYLVVQIAADDDLDSANNLAGTASSAITSLPVIISPPQVDYIVQSVASTGPIVSGGPLTGHFIITNTKSDTGLNANVQWTAYVSTDATNAYVAGIDKTIDSGTTPAPAGTLSTGLINFSGTWPTPAPGPYYLKVAVSSPDDIDNTNNVSASASAINTTHVDYDVSLVASTGAPPLLAPGPLSGHFTLANIGDADGSQTVTWVTWASVDTVINGGDTPVASGTIPGGLAHSAFQVVNFSGTWPTPAGTEYLIVSITAADDTGPGANVALSPQVTTRVPNVDYSVNTGSIISTGPIVSGGPLTGQFVLHNGGLDAGTQTAYWTAYVSTDSTSAIVAGVDKVIDSNTTAGRAPGVANDLTITFSGTWPTPAPGPYYLKVAVSSADDINNTNNVTVITTPINTTHVDYQVSAVQNTGALVAPGPVNGKFTLTNIGDANGTKTITWVAWASTDAAIDGSDTPVASGTRAGLAAGAPSAVDITFSGTWPTPVGTEYLIVSVTAADDTGPGANVAVSPQVTTRVPNVDYDRAFMTVTSTGPILSGGPLTGQFVLYNNGSDPGTQTVYWTAYVSTDSTSAIVAGVDKVIDSNTTGGRAPGAANELTITFSGTWPTPAQAYYLKVAVSAADDINATNNVVVSASPIITTFVNDTVASVTSTGGTVAGQAMNGTLVLENVGNADGSQDIIYTVYVSSNAILDSGDAVVASGVHVGGLNKLVPTPITFSARWPNAMGTWYLIAAISAQDDANLADNVVPSIGYSTALAHPDYSVTGVTNLAGSTTPGGAANFSFHVHNNIGAQNGTQPVSWAIYASTDTALDGSDILVAAGTVGPLDAGGDVTVQTPPSGTWPLHYGIYYLIATASVLVDIDSNPGNNAASTPGTTTVGIYSETEQNGDFTGLSNSNDFGTAGGIVLRPGMTILINGSFPNPVPGTDKDDVFEFNTGTANTITFTMTWGPPLDMALYLMTGPNAFILSSSFYTLAATSLAIVNWVPDATSTPRWIDVTDGQNVQNPKTYGKEDLSSYALEIKAN